MSNSYYNHTTFPAFRAAGSSAPMRAELDSITAGFALLPTALGIGQQGFTGGQWTNATLVTPTLGVATATSINKLTFTQPATGATLTLSDGSTFSLAGGFSTTLTATASTALTLPTTGTLATLAGTEALTNKTINGNTWTAGTGTLTLGAGKTATVSNTLTFTGTDGATVNFGAGGTMVLSASPTFTGVPAAPTAAVDTNTTQLATTAFVLAQASSVTPNMDSTAAIGTSTRFARADHTHASDTSRALLAGSSSQAFATAALNASGNITTTGTAGIGTTAQTSHGLRIFNSLSGNVAQMGINLEPVFGSDATTSGYGYYVGAATSAASYTMVSGYGMYIDDWTKGAGSTITTQYGLFIASQTKGATNYSIKTGTGQVYFGDSLTVVGASSPSQVTLGDASTTVSSQLLLRGNSSQKAWFIGSNSINAGALDFVQSTANGGTTLAGSAAMSLSNTGLLSCPGGIDKLTTASGAVSVAAATAPTTGQVLMATSGTVATWQTPTLSQYFQSSDQTVTPATVLNVAHGLGAKPKLVRVVLKNITGELGYSTGDEIPIDFSFWGGNQNFTVVYDATNVTLLYAGPAFVVNNRSTLAQTAITSANWKFVVRAWA